jgi:hypothetical protein
VVPVAGGHVASLLECVISLSGLQFALISIFEALFRLVKFEIVGQIADIEVIASGSGIRVLRHLRKAYGRGRWRKDDLVCIIDESGEDYLYHKSHFVFVDFPNSVKKKILALEGIT